MPCRHSGHSRRVLGPSGRAGIANGRRPVVARIVREEANSVTGTLARWTATSRGMIEHAPAEFDRSVRRRAGSIPASTATGWSRRASWEGARDVEVTDEMVLIVASHAALLDRRLRRPHRTVLNVRSVVVPWPHDRHPRATRPGPVRGVVTSGPQYLAGQSGHGRGPVLLDWRTVARQVVDPDRGVNVVLPRVRPQARSARRSRRRHAAPPRSHRRGSLGADLGHQLPAPPSPRQRRPGPRRTAPPTRPSTSP